MEERFMLFQETLKEEREEGRMEGRMEAYVEMLLTLLESKGVVPSEVKDKVKNEKDVEVLMRWYAIAIVSASVEQFLEKM